MCSIALCKTDTDITGSAAVMLSLRPHIEPAMFLERVKRQMAGGYHMARLKDGDAVKAVAGFRFGEFLAWGKIMYVDDLVVDDTDRGKGYGGQLLDWLMTHARENGCDQFHLDSGTHRLDAHRFYKAHGMEMSSFHFGMKL